MSMPAIRIEMFHRLSICLPEADRIDFGPGASASLLACLALEPGRFHRREVLVDQIWPETDPQEGRQRLRQALYTLRRQLEPHLGSTRDLFIADRSRLALRASSIDTDVAEFERCRVAASREASAEGRHDALARMIALYGGELLPGFYLEVFQCRRETLALQHLQALEMLALDREQAADFGTALEYARKLVSLDSFREEAHALLMRLLVAQGQIAAALKQYGELEETLREELDIAPSRCLREWRERLLAEANTHSAVIVCPSPPMSVPPRHASLTQPDSEPRVSAIPSALSSSLSSLPGLAEPSHFDLLPNHRPRLDPATSEEVDLPGTVPAAIPHTFPPAHPSTLGYWSPSAPPLPASRSRTAHDRAQSRPVVLLAGIGVLFAALLPLIWRPAGSAVRKRPACAPSPITVTSAHAARGMETWAVPLATQSGDEDSEPTNLLVDSKGNVVVCGFIRRGHDAKENVDFVTVKYAPNGRQLWQRRWDSPRHDCDQANGIATDAGGNIYVLGRTYNGDTDKGGTDYDLMLLKYDPDGRLQWSGRYDGVDHNTDLPVAVCTDGAGCIYVLGTSIRKDGRTDMILLKYAPSGRLIWKQPYVAVPVLGGHASFAPASILVSDADGVTVTGALDVGRPDAMSSAGSIWLTLRYDLLKGHVVWRRPCRRPGSIKDAPNGLASDGRGGVYVVGAADLPGEPNVGIVHLDARGTILWRHYGVGKLHLNLPCITSDSAGRITLEAQIQLDAHRAAIVLLQLDRDGNERWQKRITGIEAGICMPASPLATSDGSLFVTGTVYNQAPELGGTGQDFLTLRLDPDGIERWMRCYDGLSHDTDLAYLIAHSPSGAIYVTGRSRTGRFYNLTTVCYER